MVGWEDRLGEVSKAVGSLGGRGATAVGHPKSGGLGSDGQGHARAPAGGEVGGGAVTETSSPVRGWGRESRAARGRGRGAMAARAP